jgi:hypothetical protein
MAASTSRFAQLRSGCSGRNRWRYHCVVPGSQVQRELEGVGELDAPAVSPEHRSEAATDPAFVEPHLGLGPEHLEALLPLARAEAGEVDLVVEPQKRCPAAGLGRGRHPPQRLPDRRRGLAGEGEEDPLVQAEVEQHVQAAAVAEVLGEVIAVDVGFGEDHDVAFPPADEVAQVVEPRVLPVALGPVGPRVLDDEGRGVHAEAAHAHLEPEADDLGHLQADVRVGRVEIRLEVVEAVVVPGLGSLVPGPGALLDPGKTTPSVRKRGSASDQTYQSRYGESGLDLEDRNHGCSSDVWLTTRSIMAAPRPVSTGPCMAD